MTSMNDDEACSSASLAMSSYQSYHVIPEEEFGYSEEGYSDSSDLIRDSPLDLRIPRLQSLNEVPKSLIYPKRNKKEVISIAELIEKFYYNDTYINYNYSSKSFLENNPSLKGFSNFDESQSCSAATDYTLQEHEYSQIKCECCATDCNKNKWDIGTNTKTAMLLDSETQTPIKETKDASVQTDLKTRSTSYSGFTNKQKSKMKLPCSICHRLYASKSSYDRHMKTHVVLTNDKKIISSVLFTTEAKLEFCKKPVETKYQSEPYIIQMPRSSPIQCDACKQIFATQKDKDNHFEECVIEPFFMNKCPECSIKFYTLECLNRHISLVHKKPSSTSAYYCIFCNENFDTAYTFQVHLDKHLSP